MKELKMKKLEAITHPGKALGLLRYFLGEYVQEKQENLRRNRSVHTWWDEEGTYHK
jgi:hypothetical protein